MSEDRATEILKNAILLEKRGQAFYAKVAQQADGEAVKKFFTLMAEEEVSPRQDAVRAVQILPRPQEIQTRRVPRTRASSRPPPTSSPKI